MMTTPRRRSLRSGRVFVREFVWTLVVLAAAAGVTLAVNPLPTGRLDFFVPGTQDRGSVSGFGAVFTNVAIPTTSSLEFFTADGVSLGKYYVRVAPRGLSFLGVTFPGKIVAKVRVVPGTAAVGVPDDPASGVNVVVVDDFLYGEPVKK